MAWRDLNASRLGCLLDEGTSTARSSTTTRVANELSVSHRGPRYELSTDDCQAIRQFMQSDADALLQRCEAEAAGRMINRLACTRCHDRDGLTAIRMELIAEEGSGRLPEFLPDLTWTGEKLKAGWTGTCWTVASSGRVRPWLNARMPCFPRYAEILAVGLAHQHGLDAMSSDADAVDPELADVGRQLIQRTGLDCVQCHGVGAEMPRGDDRTQLALGINFEDVGLRMRYDYYRRFVLDPPRYDTRTKMPKLAADGRTTQLQRIYNGDAHRQFDAIWCYLQQLVESRSEKDKNTPADGDPVRGEEGVD